MKPSSDIKRLLEIMTALRTPVTGCPWDLEQDFISIAPYTIEEAYEVVDAIERQDHLDLKDELGDLLLQVVFHAQMADELGLFAFGDVVTAITTKMIRRHPHVFGDKSDLSPQAVKAVWAEIKAIEKAERVAARHAAGKPDQEKTSILEGVPPALPGLTRAVKLQEKAGKVGFDWNDPREVIKKIREEIDEVEEALDRGSHDEVAGEVGDVLFAVANLARHLKVDPEGALRLTNAKFMRRFHAIEDALARQSRSFAQTNLDELEMLWNAAKQDEGK